MSNKQTISIVIPAKNEVEGLRKLLPELVSQYPGVEIIVVDDGSEDKTQEFCESIGVICVHHPYSKGNGAAIKSGARRATGEIIVFMDGDGQHKAIDVQRLIDTINQGYDMVVGARSTQSQASVGRLLANTFYNRFASWMVRQKIQDLTSGFRAVKAELFREFLHLLPNGFSYPTTSTMCFFRAGHSVGYMPIVAEKRIGKSHINLIRDGTRFLLIIFKIGTLFSPLKLFLPISIAHMVLGLVNYLYTYVNFGTFTNMSALFMSSSVIIFLMGLISEQITSLMFIRIDTRQ